MKKLTDQMNAQVKPACAMGACMRYRHCASRCWYSAIDEGRKRHNERQAAKREAPISMPKGWGFT